MVGGGWESGAKGAGGGEAMREHPYSAPHGVRYSGGRAKKKAHLELPHKSQEDCVRRVASKISPYYEVDESIFGLSFTQLHGVATALSNQPKIRLKCKVGWPKQHDMT